MSSESQMAADPRNQPWTAELLDGGDLLAKQAAELEQASAALAETERAVEKEAAGLEREIRKLAMEEAELQRRKNELQVRAQRVGMERAGILERRAKLESQRTELAGQAARLERSQAEREVAALQEAIQRQQRESEARRLASQRHRAANDLRARPRLPVAVDVSMETESNFYMGLTENLSEGGLFLATYDDLRVGTELDLHLTLPGRRITARGVVRWTREYSRFTEDVSPGVGIQFLGLAAEDQQAIAAFLRTRDPILYDV
ncbi:MAG TPA: TIGR02266 family protein [Myxococcota bacterium]|nr:TIGR02266 family protein [Myxococcota bacterium]HRY97270.1 TIGR02266 family protein [Myxococcota bacterium]HSA24664.1 TIGR02266 family protein [Myxococcota bacterium]